LAKQAQNMAIIKEKLTFLAPNSGWQWVQKTGCESMADEPIQ
jgi:hypothetical protein